MRQRWPARLWLVRHGQSAGNVARDQATAAGKAMIDLKVRDVDVPLSPLGERQAEALGRWFAGLPEAEKPEIAFSSPYVRARQTAQAIPALPRTALLLAPSFPVGASTRTRLSGSARSG